MWIKLLGAPAIFAGLSGYLLFKVGKVGPKSQIASIFLRGIKLFEPFVIDEREKQAYEAKMAREGKKKSDTVSTELPKNLIQLNNPLIDQLIGYHEWNLGLSLALYVVINVIFSSLYAHFFVAAAAVSSIPWLLTATLFFLTSIFGFSSTFGRATNSKERIWCVWSIIMALFGSLLLFHFQQDKLLDFKIDSVYNAARDFINSQAAASSSSDSTLSSVRLTIAYPQSSTLFKFILSIIATILTPTLLFAGVFAVRMHGMMENIVAAGYGTRYYRISKFFSLLNLVSPLFVSLLYLRPIVRYVLPIPISFISKYIPILSTIPQDELIDSLRLYAILFCVVLQLVSVRPYLQSFLFCWSPDIPYICIRSKDKFQYRERMNERIQASFSSLCAQALQYMTPTLLMISLVVVQFWRGGVSLTFGLLPSAAPAASTVTAAAATDASSFRDELRSAIDQLSNAFDSSKTSWTTPQLFKLLSSALLFYIVVVIGTIQTIAFMREWTASRKKNGNGKTLLVNRAEIPADAASISSADEQEESKASAAAPNSKKSSKAKRKAE